MHTNLLLHVHIEAFTVLSLFKSWKPLQIPLDTALKLLLHICACTQHTAATHNIHACIVMYKQWHIHRHTLLNGVACNIMSTNNGFIKRIAAMCCSINASSNVKATATAVANKSINNNNNNMMVSMYFYFKSSTYSIWKQRRLLPSLVYFLPLHVAAWLWNATCHVALLTFVYILSYVA